MPALDREAILDIGMQMLEGGASLDQVIAAAAAYGVNLYDVYYADPGTSFSYVEPEPVYVAPEPIYVAPEPIYVAPPQPVAQDRYTPAQYAAAGDFIAANIDKPEVIIQAVAELGLTVEEVTKAAQTVDATVTVEQVETYLAQEVTPEPEPIYVAPEPIYVEPEAIYVKPGDIAMPTYTPEQYEAAGQFIVANLNNPELIAQTAANLGLSIEEITLAAQTVDATITVDAVENYFQDNDVIFDKPFVGGIYAFETAAERDAYLQSGDPNLTVFYKAAGISAPAQVTQPVIAPVLPVAPVVPVQITQPPVVTPAPVVKPVPVIPAPVNVLVPPANQTAPIVPAAPAAPAAGNLLPIAAIAAYLLLGS